MNIFLNPSAASRLSLALLVLALVSLFFPVTGDGGLPAALYMGIQAALVLSGSLFAVVAARRDGKPPRSAWADLRLQAAVFLLLGVGLQAGFDRWPLWPLSFFLLFPFTGFARRFQLVWVPALVPVTAAAGRTAIGGYSGLVPWALAFLFFCVALGFRISKDHRAIVTARSHLDRIKSDAREVMGRLHVEDRGEALDRIRGEEAATAAALDEDDLLQKLLIWGCHFFGARTGILLVPEGAGFFRMRAAVHRGVEIVEDMVPADKGFIHIAAQRGGVLCVDDARSAARSLGFYPPKTQVGSFIVKILYDTSWAKDAGDGAAPGKIRSVLYFDSETVGDLTLDAGVSKRLDEFGALILRTMGMSHLVQRMTTDMSVKDAIARYARSLTRKLDPGYIAAEALEAMREVLPKCDGGVVLLSDEEGGSLSVEAFSGDTFASFGNKDPDKPDGGLETIRILREEPSQLGLLLRRFAEVRGTGSGNGAGGVEILINNEQARKSPFFHRGEKLGKIVSFAAIPCFMGVEEGSASLKAVIVAVSRQAEAFGREEMGDLRILAGMMTPALDNAIQHRKVDDLARTDGLTGLLNHRVFQIVLAGKISKMARYGRSIAVIMVDADRFKGVNDTYGHSVGDEVLVELARRLKALLRKNDAVARYGGEEFTVVLDEVGGDDARRIAEKMRRSIAGRPFATSAGPIPVTASFGFSILRKGDATSKKELLDRADQALYYAKENGRNRVVSYEDLTARPAGGDRHPVGRGAESTGEIRS